MNPHLIEKEVNNLIDNCCKKPFRAKESIIALKLLYENLLQLRAKIISQFPKVSADPATEAIIELLNDITKNKMAIKKVEWTYDHYIDLFKFKAEELLLEVLEKQRQPA